MASSGLERRKAVKSLLAQREKLLVVTGLGSSTYDVCAAGDRDENFYLWGAMGGAAMVGLGLAAAQPERPVAVITGDGEALMGMGALATVATSRVPNLTIVVLDNGRFGETGGQYSHTGLGVDLAAVAQAVGIKRTMVVEQESQSEAARDFIHDTGDGPRLMLVKIAPSEDIRALPVRDGAFLKTRIRAHLGYAAS